MRNDSPIRPLIIENIKSKKKGLGGLKNLEDSLLENRPMTTIGG